MMPLVEIYTRKFCPYCVRAKELLDELAIIYKEYDIGVLPEARADMIARADGRTSVPQVFVDGLALGGCDDITAMHANGALLPLLRYS